MYVSWVATAIGAVALVFGYLTYRRQRNSTRLEYVVLTNTRLLPGRLARSLQVSHEGEVLSDPSFLILRIANTGTQAIKPAAFETDLIVTFHGITEVASATWVGSRPRDLRPDLEIDGITVRIKPALVNSGEMVELQALADGEPGQVEISGRIAELAIAQRDSLPYPPGSGREGEMLRFDRVMWFVLSPLALIAFGALSAFGGNASSAESLVICAVTALIVGVLYPLQVRYLVRRRRAWRLE